MGIRCKRRARNLHLRPVGTYIVAGIMTLRLLSDGDGIPNQTREMDTVYACNRDVTEVEKALRGLMDAHSRLRESDEPVFGGQALDGISDHDDLIH